MHRLPSIPIDVGLGAGFAPLLDLERRRSLEVDLTDQIEGLLHHLGVPGRAELTLSHSGSDRDLVVAVDSRRRDFGWDLVRRSSLGLKDDIAPARERFPHGWGSEDADSASHIVRCVVPAVVAESPACLLGDAQVASYFGDLTGVPTSRVETAGRILRFLLDLGVAIGGDRRSYLRETFMEEPAFTDERRDWAERLFAQFRDTVTIFVSSDLEAALVGEDTTSPVSVYSDRLPDQARGRVRLLEEWLYFRMGIQLPDIYWHRKEDLPSSTVAVEVNDRVHPPLPTSKESFLSDVYAEISRLGYRLLGIEDVESQLAHLQASAPDLVQAALSTVSISELTRALRTLQREMIPTHDLKGVLERLLRFETIPVDGGETMLVDPRLPVLKGVTRPLWVDYVEFIRHGIRYRLAHDQVRGRLLLALNREAESDLEAALRGDSKRAPGEEGVTRLKDRIWQLLHADGAGRRPTLLTRPTIRWWVEGLLAGELPEAAVVARSEIPPTEPAEPDAVVGFASADSPVSAGPVS